MMTVFATTPVYGPYFFDKRTNLFVDSTFNLVKLTSGPYDYQAVGVDFDLSLNRAYFATISSLNSAQFYYIGFENCTSRTGGICTSCPAGTYLSNTSINNECLEPDQFPLAYGLDTGSLIIKPCQLTNCKYC